MDLGVAVVGVEVMANGSEVYADDCDIDEGTVGLANEAYVDLWESPRLRQP